MIPYCANPIGGASSSSDRSRKGMTIVELVVAMVVLIIAVGSAMASISSFVVLGDAAREKNLALLEAQSMVERLRTENFRTIFVRYNTTAADNGGLPAPGHTFNVKGLAARKGDPDGAVGKIDFPVDPAGAPTVLRETSVLPEFGFPRDLTGDGFQDGADRSGDYIVLPARIRVEWTSRSGDRAIELHTLLRNQ